MKSITKSILLTVVVALLSSVSWAQNCTTEEKNRLQDELSAAENAYNACTNKGCDSNVIAAMTAARVAFNKCDRARTADSEFCKSTVSAINEITKKFDHDQMQQAVKCYGAELEEPADATRAILMTMAGGGYDNSDSSCRIQGKENDYQKQYEKMMKQIEQYEKDLRALEEKIVKQTKEAQEKVTKMNDDRVDMREAFEQKQTEQQANQQKALRAMQENQMKIQEAIRKANAELINARQELAKSKRKQREELFKAGVDSYASMARICQSQQDKYCKENPKACKKRTSKGLGQALSKGSGKAGDLIGLATSCMKSLEERRNSIVEDTSNYEIQMANNLRDRESAIQDLETQFKQQVSDFNSALERESAAMNKAQQAYMEKDRNLANQIMAFQQAAQQEAMQLNQQKLSLQQKIMAAHKTRGEVSAKEVTAAVGAYKEYMDNVKSLAGGSDNFSDDGLKDSKLIKCPDEWARYKSQASQFSSDLEEIKSNEGTTK